MGEARKDYDKGALESKLLNEMPVAVTAVDAEGKVIYYNDYAAATLVRKPSQLGEDVRRFHKPESVEKIDAMLAEFKAGRTEPYQWKVRDDRLILIVAPLLEGGKYAGCFECVVPNTESRPASAKGN